MEEIGGWVIERLLGEGGVASVYLARGKGAGIPVALKVIAAARCNDEARARFVHEVRAVQRIRHPGVVRILGFGQTRRGDLYLAMELLEGENLDERIERGGALPSPEVVRIGCATAAALGAAHAAGIIHRDVKPANVFVCADGGLKVVDFGLALQVGMDGATRLTGMNLIVGTPAYMAFEQARGTKDEDARTDVWGLGASLYHAASGRLPFEAPSLMAQLARVVTDEPDPMPEEVPGWLQAAILKGLRKEPAERWQSMQDFARALEDGLARATGSSLPPVRRSVPPVALGDEVRIVAALFAEGVDDAAVFVEEVTRLGGHASPLLGRRAVGVFGGQAWKGDEAERAVRAGLLIRERTPGALLGIATGHAVQSSGGGVPPLTGAAIAGAQEALSPIGVGADPETLRRVRGGFDVEDGRVLRRRPGLRVIGVRGIGGTEIPLVGRAAELALLTRMLDQVIEQSWAEGVLLTGPAGVGKSRLRRALQLAIEEHAARIFVLEARGEANRTLEAWHAIGNALRQRLEVPEGTEPEVVRQRLDAACATRTVAEFLGELLGAGYPESPHLRTARADPAVMRDHLRLAFGDWVEALSEEAPVVLFAEDLQWADAPSLELIEILLRRLDGRRLLVVGVARPELEAPSPSWKQIELEALSPDATKELVLALLGDHPDADVRADEIVERSRGNPFFAEELALAVRQGLSVLPTSVEAAIQARLDGLPRAEKDLLRRAAVLGRRFWVEALEAPGEVAPEALLAPLRRREPVAPEIRTRLAGAREWRFRSALVREVAERSLTAAQRAQLHIAAGRWLAERPDAPAAEVAAHLDAGGDRDGAASFYRRAAEAARRDGHPGAAADTAGRALALAAAPLERFELRMLRAEAFHYLGRRADEEAELAAAGGFAKTGLEQSLVYERLARLLRLSGRADDVIEVVRTGLGLAPGSVALLVQLAAAWAESGHAGEALDAAAEALAAARAGGDPATLGLALSAAAHCHAVIGDVGSAWPLCEEASRVLEEAGDLQRLAAARVNLGGYGLALGRVAEGAADLERARELCRAVGHRRGEGYANQDLGLARAALGALPGAMAAEKAALEIATELPEPRLRDITRQCIAWIHLSDGRPQEALAALDELAATSPRLQGTLAAQVRTLRALVLSALGRVEDAHAATREALDLRAKVGGMEHFEAELWLAAHEAGVEDALARGAQALRDKAARIADPELRARFLAATPARVRLLGAA